MTRLRESSSGSKNERALGRVLNCIYSEVVFNVFVVNLLFCIVCWFSR